MRYIIILLFFFRRGRVTHTAVFSYRVDAPLRLWYRMPSDLIEVLFYLARRSPWLRFSYSFTGRPVFVSTRFIVRSEIDFDDKRGFNEDVGAPFCVGCRRSYDGSVTCIRLELEQDTEMVIGITEFAGLLVH